MKVAIAAALALVCSGSCALRQRIGIDEVVAALTAADRKIDNYVSLERSVAYDRDGRVKRSETRGVHFYAKPDESVLCVWKPAAASDIYYEAGTTVRTIKDGTSIEQTLSDSFFLRDWRSMILLHREREETSPLQFEFATGDPRTTPRRDDGVYVIRVTRPGHEMAILEVNLRMGVVLEKSVYQLPGGNRSARELHSEFVPLAGSYLPGKTIYEYRDEKVVIYWSQYRVNVPVDLKRMNLDQTTCERLAALTPAREVTAVASLDAARGNE